MARRPQQTAEPNEADAFPMPDLSEDVPYDIANDFAAGPAPEPTPDNVIDAGTYQQPKRRQRKGKKAPEPKPPVTPEAKAQAAKALALGFQMTFKLASRARGDHWQLDPAEAQALGEVWSEALAPWLPYVAGAAPWAAAIIVTYSCVEPRLTRDAEIAKVAGAEPVSEDAPAIRVMKGDNL